MTDIVIQGIYGRMGHALIEKIAARQDCRVVAGVDREAGKVGDIPVYAGFEGLPKVDAIIDFSSPAGAVAAVSGFLLVTTVLVNGAAVLLTRQEDD